MKNEKNKPIFVVCGVFFVFFIVIVGINIMLTDNRENMTSLPEAEMGFVNTVVELEDMYWNKDSGMAEINYKKIDFFMVSEDVSVSLSDQDGQLLNVDIIKGESNLVTEDIYETEYKIIFEMPDEVWYLKGEFVRDEITHMFTIDYRDFTKVK